MSAAVEDESEIERRWMVKSVDPDVMRYEARSIVQGYFEAARESSFRVRLIDGRHAILAKKSGRGVERRETPNPIEYGLGEFILDAAPHKLRKKRRVIEHYGRKWELDTFEGNLAGFMLLECECKTVEEVMQLTLPPWIKEAVEVTDSLTNYHLALLNSELEHVAPERPVREYLPQRLPRVVLTGGPCSGKSTVLREIKQRFGDRIHCVPEVATILIDQVGVKPPKNDPLGMARFQRTLIRVQEIFEDAAERQALSDGKQLMVLDRGMLDNAAYLNGGKDDFERTFGMRVNAALARYEAVLILRVPPPEVYERMSGNNPARSEDYVTAEQLSTRIQDAWVDHPRQRVIQNNNSMADKCEAAIQFLMEMVRPLS